MADDATGVAIVAIPSQDDYVWKTSSEKVPHMTMLYLGEITDPEILDRIAQYVEHVAATSMRRFGMTVDHRGPLGPNEADVLFFDQPEKMVSSARSYLLDNPDINLAYNSVEQYPQWTPHLTLGYPTAPAKPDNRDYPGIGWVNFDRIALWTGDYEGPEFRLDDNHALEVSMSDKSKSVLAHAEPTVQDIYDGMTSEQKDLMALIVGAAVSDEVLPPEANVIHSYDSLSNDQKNIIDFIVAGAMTNQSSVQHSDDPVDAFLAHHGVKGMKWGVRKDNYYSGRNAQKNWDKSNRGEFHAVTKSENKALRDMVKSGNASLGDAHLAALKSTGHRAINGFLGDKTFWKRTAIVAGAAGVGLAASVAVPGLLPASLLAHVGLHSVGTVGVIKTAAAATKASGSLVTPHTAAVLIGRGVITGVSSATTGVGAGVAQGANSVANFGRAVRGNARINKSYIKLGEQVMKNQTSGSKQVNKVLNRNGSIAKKNLKHEDPVENFLAHHGVKGMKWGVRRSDAQLGNGGSGGIRSRFKKKSGGVEPAKSSTNSSASPEKKPPEHVAVDVERIVRTLNKENHSEMSTQEMRDAINRAKVDKEYNDFFSKGGPNKDLQAAVDRLELQKQYRDLTAQLNPPKRSAVQKLIGASESGFSAYSKLDKATGGELSKNLGKKISSAMGIKDVVAEAEAARAAEGVTKAKAETQMAVANARKASAEAGRAEVALSKVRETLPKAPDNYVPSKATQDFLNNIKGGTSLSVSASQAKVDSTKTSIDELEKLLKSSGTYSTKLSDILDKNQPTLF